MHKGTVSTLKNMLWKLCETVVKNAEKNHVTICIWKNTMDNKFVNILFTCEFYPYELAKNEFYLKYGILLFMYNLTTYGFFNHK